MVATCALKEGSNKEGEKSNKNARNRDRRSAPGTGRRADSCGCWSRTRTRHGTSSGNCPGDGRLQHLLNAASKIKADSSALTVGEPGLTDRGGAAGTIVESAQNLVICVGGVEGGEQHQITAGSTVEAAANGVGIVGSLGTDAPTVRNQVRVSSSCRARGRRDNSRSR